MKERIITYTEKSFVLSLLILLMIISPFSSQAQLNPIKSFEGIPIITYARSVNSAGGVYIPPEQYDTIRNAGIKFIQVENMFDNVYQSHLQGKGLMILPEQYFYNQQTNNYITYYTEGRYTEWPTIETDTTDGKATLKYLETHTEKFGGVLRTKQTQGTPLTHDTIVFGPQYWQDIYYRFHNGGDSIQYTVRFKLKLEKLNPQESSVNDTICILLVTAKDTYHDIDSVFTTGLPVYVIQEKAVTYGELLPLNNYKTFDILYRLDQVPDSISNQPLIGNSIPYWQKNISGKKNLFAAVKNIEFRIVWKSNSEIFRLYMDTIKVFDQRGEDLMFSNFAQQLIKDQVTYAIYRDSVAGWMSVDEPMSIDQMAPLRKVNELIESVQPNTGLWVNYNGSWNGRFGNAADPGYTMPLVRFDELIRRVKKANIWVVMNPFDWPDCPASKPDYRNANLGIVDSVLAKLANTGKNYDNLFYGLCYQTGNYKNNDVGSQICSREIEDYEFLYLSNLALLYGSKVLTPWLWFGSNGGYTGVVNSINGVFTNTEKYYVIKNKLSPRLSGLMGKTLKRLKASEQFVADKAMVYPYNTSKRYINKLIWTTNTQSTPPIYDVGFFFDPVVDQSGYERRYFMLIDRYYPNRDYDNIKIEFRNLSDYKNWKFTNFADTTSYSIISEINGYGITNEISFTKGDGYLFGLHPVVKYGGTLIANDTIKSNTTLSSDMWINSNVNLIINRGKYYTIQDTVTLFGTGFITGAGYLNIAQGGEIKIASWSKSVFKGRESINPKIIWGRYPTSGTVAKYRIFRAKGNNQFIQIAEVDSTKRQFIDSTTIIYDRPQANLTYADYYVRAVYQPSGNAPLSTSSNSNTIRYDMVDGIAPDKLAMSSTDIITEYRLEQNYPNPFNPTTIISWQSPKAGHQTLKVYDILGNEVAVLVDEYREAGRYTVEFSATQLPSGVYIYRLSVGDFVDVKKMIVVK
ncbi:T9SS type A sorting domain-containing protein [Ignavibacterium sp.]|jgi:hypothetical protein|uniref:T9SS type A sorting domain-containing protein n=1 Tax=Ignavibacterium sp. TaxID=2651167 RepID=UPI003296CEED